jgi:poly-beta-hydroxyalkanoate depolymerase
MTPPASTTLCTVEGDRDDITGAGQTHVAHMPCSAISVQTRCRLTISDCDHYDLFTGPKWHKVIHPAVVQFWASVR